MTPLERAAQALGTVHIDEIGPLDGALDRKDLIAAVKLVLQALREPSEAMLSASCGYVSKENWAEMIDAALEEGPKV